MAKKKYKSIYQESHSKDELKEIRRTLAKRANQRMVRLERATSEISGESYASYGAIDQVKYYLKGKRRFSENLKYTDDIDLLKREINELQKFLESPSSLVSGQRAIEKKRQETFASGQWGGRWEKDEKTGEWKKVGVTGVSLKNASNKEFFNFLRSNTFHNLVAKGFTSEQIVEIFDAALERDKRTTPLSITRRLEEAYAEWAESGKMGGIKDLQQRFGVNILKGSGNQ